MKKSQKQDKLTRRLRLAREVIVELRPRQLAEAAGGSSYSGNPRCTDPELPQEN